MSNPSPTSIAALDRVLHRLATDQRHLIGRFDGAAAGLAEQPRPSEPTSPSLDHLLSAVGRHIGRPTMSTGHGPSAPDEVRDDRSGGPEWLHDFSAPRTIGGAPTGGETDADR